MPNRILKESICTSDNIDKLSAFEETVFYRLIVNCDDFGRFDGRPKIIASKLFPLKDIRTNQIESALRALTSAELVILYEVDGKPFLQMKTWDRHQQIRAKKSKYPAPEDGNITSASICNQLISDDSKCPRNPIQSESESESNPIERAQTAKRFAPPSVEDVTAYCRERKNNVDAQRFVDFYASKGWKIGQNPMKDWKAAVRTWEQRDRTPVQMPVKQVMAAQYTQREYDEADLEARLGVNDIFKGAAG
jgi:hypothetical protein